MATWHKLDDEGGAELRVRDKRITSFPSYSSAQEAAERINTALYASPVPAVEAGWRTEEVVALRSSLKALVEACERADANEELPEEVDGSLLDAATEALEMQYPVIWTEADVELLKRRQDQTMSHPYTCGGNRSDALHVAQAEEDGDGDTGILIPTRRGWVCPACDYRQFWAHEVTNAPSAPGEPLPEEELMAKAVTSATEKFRDWYFQHTGKRIYHTNAQKAVDLIIAALEGSR